MNVRPLGHPAKALLSNCILLVALGCAPASRIEASSSAEPREEQILVSPQSHVCVRVTVDPSIWPYPVDAETVRNLSGVLMPELRRLYEERGGSDSMPGTNNQQRFYTNHISHHPFCQDNGTNVLVSAHYAARPDGKPFIVRYTLRRGTKSLSYSASVDVDAEMRAGRMKPYWIMRKNDAVIGGDIVRRSLEIMNRIQVSDNK